MGLPCLHQASSKGRRFLPIPGASPQGAFLEVWKQYGALEAHGPHLAASFLQHLGISHSLVNLWEDADLACDRNRKLFVG